MTTPELTPRAFAKARLRPYVLRGDSLESLREGHMGWYRKEGNADNPWQGKLYRKWIVECRHVGCNSFDEHGTYLRAYTRMQAEAFFRSQGWRRYPRKGWYCPVHATKEAAQ